MHTPSPRHATARALREVSPGLRCMTHAATRLLERRAKICVWTDVLQLLHAPPREASSAAARGASLAPHPSPVGFPRSSTPGCPPSRARPPRASASPTPPPSSRARGPCPPSRRRDGDGVVGARPRAAAAEEDREEGGVGDRRRRRRVGKKHTHRSARQCPARARAAANRGRP